MGLNKGQTNNLHGRPKGSRNKTSIDLRLWITNFIQRNTKQIESDWDSLEPKDRIVLFERLLKYSLPQLQAINMKRNFDSMSDEELDIIIEELKQFASHGD